MTRYTNLGLKRTYVEAGFDQAQEAPAASADNTTHHAEADSTQVQDADAPADPPKKKKRIRRKPPKKPVAEGAEDITASPTDPSSKNSSVKKESKGAKKRRKAKAKELEKFRDGRKSASENRRLRRQHDRDAEITCFACREKGHAARDCPTAISAEDDGKRKTGKQTVGICYRCGSKKHTLSRCKTPADPENPLPFSSCFVCSGMGHLASSCPQNQSRGVYPNGGCCKLCRETSHLAKDCTLRKNEGKANTVLWGTGQEAGADEDDFHTFKRKTAEVVREEKVDEQRKKKADVRVGAHSGVMKSFGQAAVKPKKVVAF